MDVAVTQLARAVVGLSERQLQFDKLKSLVEQIDRSGLYVVLGELDMLKTLQQRLDAARSVLEGLAANGAPSPATGDPTSGVTELSGLLSGAPWRHADRIADELAEYQEVLDAAAADLGAWVAPWRTRVDELERRLLQVTAEGVSPKALKEERDGLERLKQLVGTVDEALRNGSHNVAMGVRARLQPPTGSAPSPAVTATAGEPPVPDVDQLVKAIDEKAAAGRTMTQLAEVLLLRGPATPMFREYTFVLRTPSAPGSQGVSIHDTFRVGEQDHLRAGRGAATATGAVGSARRARQATRDFTADTPEHVPPGNLAEKLRDVGDLLYRIFLPGFAQVLLRDSLCPVSITTNDVTLPWELLHDGEEFLSLSRPLARMPTGRALPRRFRRRVTSRRLRFLLAYADPRRDLPNVRDEVEFIRDSLTRAWGDRIDVVVEGRPTGGFFNDALRRGDFDVIHFAGHADFVDAGEDDKDDAQDAGLLLYGDSDGSTEIFPASKILGFVEGSPIVFLNACNTGKSGEAELGDVSYAAKPAAGLGSAFVYGGALACVGSLWPVYDEPARFFAGEFYNAIVDRDSIGAAMLAARRATNARYPDDATWASFVLFGNPTFRLDTSVEAAALAARSLLTSS